MEGVEVLCCRSGGGVEVGAGEQKQTRCALLYGLGLECRHREQNRSSSNPDKTVDGSGSQPGSQANVRLFSTKGSIYVIYRANT